MNIELILSIILIAVLDSLNPTLFISQLYLLTTPQPIVRTLSFITGILVVNFTGGLLILLGLRTVIGDFINTFTPSTLYGIQFLLGAGLIAFGMWYRAKKVTTSEHKPPLSLRPFFTFVLGMIVMLNEITTALPYFIAIERIVGANMGFGGNLAALVLYNFVFSLPLFGFVGLFLGYRQRFDGQITVINQWIARWTPRVLKYGALIFGILLALNAGAFFVTGKPML